MGGFTNITDREIIGSGTDLAIALMSLDAVTPRGLWKRCSLRSGPHRFWKVWNRLPVEPFPAAAPVPQRPPVRCNAYVRGRKRLVANGCMAKHIPARGQEGSVHTAGTAQLRQAAPNSERTEIAGAFLYPTASSTPGRLCDRGKRADPKSLPPVPRRTNRDKESDRNASEPPSAIVWVRFPAADGGMDTSPPGMP